MQIMRFCLLLNEIKIRNNLSIMSSTLDPIKLYQLSMHYDRHRLKLNRIKSQTSPIIKKQKQQISIMTARNAHREYNAKFKYRQSMMEINKKNEKIHDKIQDLSQVRKKKPNSVSFDKLRNSMLVNRSVSKIESSKNMEVQNQRFVRKLVDMKSTFSNKKLDNSYSEHRMRSQMLSKFKKNDKGFNIPKSESMVNKRIVLQPMHRKLQLMQSRFKQKKAKFGNPINFNSVKLLRMNQQIKK